MAVNKTLVFSPAVDRSFDRLPAEVADQVVQALYVFGLTGQGDVKRLKGSRLLRLRVGDHRVVFEEQGDRLAIVLVAHRRDVYR